jgi:hypothetical protein
MVARHADLVAADGGADLLGQRPVGLVGEPGLLDDDLSTFLSHVSGLAALRPAYTRTVSRWTGR